jgi:hypothetical protein
MMPGCLNPLMGMTLQRKIPGNPEEGIAEFIAGRKNR